MNEDDRLIQELKQYDIMLDAKNKLDMHYFSTLKALRTITIDLPGMWTQLPDTKNNILDEKTLFSAGCLLRFYCMKHGRFLLAKRQQYAQSHKFGLYLAHTMRVCPANMFGLHYQVGNIDPLINNKVPTISLQQIITFLLLSPDQALDLGNGHATSDERS